jgi:hypothetical protein
MGRLYRQIRLTSPVINSHPEGVCRLRPESFSELALRLAGTLLLKSTGYNRIAGEGFTFRIEAASDDEPANGLGWFLACATVTAIL